MDFIRRLGKHFSDGDPRHDYRRVFDPEDYEAAPAFYVKEKLGDLKSPWNPVNLVRDVAALDTGGELREADEFLKEVEGNYEDVYRKVPEDERGQYDHSKHEYVPALEEYRAFQAAAAAFVETVDLDKVNVGDSPIQRAINYMASLAKSQAPSQRGQGDPESDRLPEEFKEGAKAGKEMAQKLNEAWDKVSKMSEQERQDLHAMERNEDGRKGNNGHKPNKGWDKSQHRPNLMVDLVSMVINNNTVDILDTISRNLDNRVETQVVQEIDFTEVVGGPHITVRDIDGMHEIPMLAPYEMAQMQVAPEYTLNRIIKGEAQVMPRGERLTKKQLTVMVVDVSGSMFWGGTEANWRAAIGILKNRIDYALSGKGDLHWALFATHVDEITAIENSIGDLTMPLAYLHERMKNNHLGGGTSIAKAVRKAVSYIADKWDPDEHNARPEIVVVTDGEAGEGDSILNSWEKFEQDVGPLRINTFFISRGREMREIMEKRVNDEYFEKDELGWHATPALAYIAQESGGGIWAINPADGAPIMPHEFMGLDTPDEVKYNPWSRGW